LKIALGNMKDKGEDLAGFLEPRVGTKPAISGDSIEIDDGSVRAGVRPRHVKTYIKRFMYMNGLRKNYRVFVAGKELTIQELELGEEAEEKKPKAEGPEAPEAPAKEEAKEEEAEPEKEEKVEEPKAEKPKKAARKPKAAKKKKESAED
jgi:hypothetical protein